MGMVMVVVVMVVVMVVVQTNNRVKRNFCFVLVG